MKCHILTLFPDMVLDGLRTSILGRAEEKGVLSLHAVNIRDFAENKHNRVDDAPYGGGAGLLMQPGPVYSAWKSVTEACAGQPRVIYLTPQGRVFNQGIAEELAGGAYHEGGPSHCEKKRGGGL